MMKIRALAFWGQCWVPPLDGSPLVLLFQGLKLIVEAFGLQDSEQIIPGGDSMNLQVP